MSLRRRVHAGASEDLTSLVSSADMPNPNQQTANFLNGQSVLVGQISDPRVVTIVFALLIAASRRVEYRERCWDVLFNGPLAGGFCY